MNQAGGSNIAVGVLGLWQNTSGYNNIAIGNSAGASVVIGSDNIYIGNAGGSGGESNRIRIGTVGTQTAIYIAGISGVTVPGGVGVIVGNNGKLGTVVSSVRFKEAIKPMDMTSGAILALKPVTFRYKHELDPQGIQQFGLVAEDVEKVNPDLVASDEHGKPYTVRYEAVNAMLLNEFLKERKAFVAEQRKVQEQGATIAQLKSAVTRQEATAREQKKEIAALTSRLKEQAAQIQKVSAQIEASKPAPQTVVSNP